MEAAHPSGAARTALVHDFLLDLRGAERVFAELCDLSPDADIFTAVYDERGDRGAVRRPARPHVVPAAPAPHRAHVPRAAAAVPLRDGGARPARLRAGGLELERRGRTAVLVRRRRGPRLLLPQPVPLRVERPRETALAVAAARSSAPAQRDAVALAPVGLDRRPARRPLHRQLEITQAPDPRLLQPRRRRRVPAGRRRALRARAGRRLLPGRLRADAATSGSTWRSRRSTAAPAAAGRAATARTPAACGRSAGPTIRFAGRLSDAEASPQLLAGARALVRPRLEEFGIAAVEAQAAGRPVIATAGRRRAGDGARRRHRHVLSGHPRRTLSSPPWSASTSRRSNRAPACANAARFDAAAFPTASSRRRAQADHGAVFREPRRSARARGLATRAAAGRRAL